MSKYIDKEKLIDELKFKIKHKKDMLSGDYDFALLSSQLWEREFKAELALLEKILEEINTNVFDIEPPKLLENSVTAQAIKADYIEDSKKWLDDEFSDKKDEWITEKTEQILLDNDGEFIVEIIEEIINADLPL